MFFLDDMAICDGRLGVVVIAAVMTVMIVFEYESLVSGKGLCCALAASSVLAVLREWPFAVDFRPESGLRHDQDGVAFGR